MHNLTKKQRLLQLQTKHLLLFSVGVFIICIAAWYGLVRVATPAQPQRLVTFYDRGSERSVLTIATTVAEALHAADITVDPNDVIDPTVDTSLTESRADIIIYRSRPIIVQDGAKRQTIMTTSQSPNAILRAIGFDELERSDVAALSKGGEVATTGRAKLVVTRVKKEEVKKEPVVFTPKPNALTRSKGAHVYVDSDGVAHRETYYDLPMNIVIGACGPGGSYSIRSDGAKVDQDGYVLVAAGFAAYPRCSIVDTSMGPGKVYDTGGFALRHPYGFDLATDWTNFDGV